MRAILPLCARRMVANLLVLPLSLQQMTNLDDTDHRILRELSRDARQSNLALADRIGLSPSVWRDSSSCRD